MATFTVAAIQVAYDDVESIADRITRVSDLVRATAAEHAGLDLIVLPELWAPTGFDYERWESAAHQRVHMEQPHMARLREIKDKYIADTRLGCVRLED